MKPHPVAMLILGLVSSTVAVAEPIPGLTIGGFIDAYYAYDLNSPPSRDRAYTTQPARHNEFNLNLAYIEAKIEREKVHGRLALQAGTSVQSNYAGEPTVGSISGPSLSRNIQEAYVGYRLGSDTWIDAGIMLSHIGVESFISKDNILYTRSLVADYSPYYETGVRLSTKFNDQFSGQLLILNGWQNISENNSDKALGTQLRFSPSSELSFTYNTFFGREGTFRHFHDLIVKFAPSEAWVFHLQADVGFQEASGSASSAVWKGASLMAKRKLSQSLALTGRVEHYSDPKQVLINSASASLPSGTSFEVSGASFGIDTTLDTNAWWRNEIRGYWAKDPVFPSDTVFKKTDGVIVSSISLAF